jgi:predicted MPP superfamily phosphohydrolase
MMNKKRKIILGVGMIFATILALCWYGFIFEPNNIQIEKINIEIENLPEAFNGAKIVHLTDFHSFGFGVREKRVLEIVSEINPDFVFITGDFVDSKTKDFDSCARFWQELGKQYNGRIFGVLGNHDINSLEKLLEQSNIVILNNENRKIFQGDDYIYLIGVNDPDTHRDNLEKAMLGAGDDVPKILLAHSPEIIEDLKMAESPDLVLVGHTHGGQVKIPFVTPFWVPTKYHGKFASGLFKIDDTYMYVNKGIGMTALPIRFNCPPEIAVIELKKK